MTETTRPGIDVELTDLTRDVQNAGAMTVIVACGWTVCAVVAN